MHELSIATNVVEIVEEEAKAKQAQKVTKLELEVGALSGVVMDALKFAMEEAVKNTIMQNASIHYHVIDGIAKCENCSEQFDTEEYFSPCLKCGHPYTDIIQGKELKIKSINIE
ncbi:MAG: hydrogenase maturation nickel metallochaperone HypA [Marinilabiliales bacterium]|nr:MAG: hydrogenase maturation nickel metallochaperone HypA [Marinilabiliales bacterium]